MAVTQHINYGADYNKSSQINTSPTSLAAPASGNLSLFHQPIPSHVTHVTILTTKNVDHLSCSAS